MLSTYNECCEIRDHPLENLYMRVGNFQAVRILFVQISVAGNFIFGEIPCMNFFSDDNLEGKCRNFHAIFPRINLFFVLQFARLYLELASHELKETFYLRIDPVQTIDWKQS